VTVDSDIDNNVNSALCGDIAQALMQWLQVRFDFDSTAVRLLIKGHSHSDVTRSQADLFIMSPPLIGGGIKRCFCLTSV